MEGTKFKGIMEYEGFGSVRYISIYNKKTGYEPWFVAKDVAKMLGYARAQNMYDTIDEDDRVTINPNDDNDGYIDFKEMAPLESEKGITGKPVNPFGESKNVTKLVIINESGFYAAALSSKKPEAKQFRHWLTSEVLPSIRKYGYYVTPEMEAAMESKKLSMEKMIDSMRRNRLVKCGIKFPEWFENNSDFVKWRDQINAGLDEIAADFGYKNRSSAMYQVYKVIWESTKISLQLMKDMYIDHQIKMIMASGYEPKPEDYLGLGELDRLHIIYATEKLYNIFTEYVIGGTFYAVKKIEAQRPTTRVLTIDSPYKFGQIEVID